MQTLASEQLGGGKNYFVFFVLHLRYKLATWRGCATTNLNSVK